MTIPFISHSTMVQYPKLHLSFSIHSIIWAKATFFMVGDNVRKYPELYEEVVRRGHLVGNHTYHHLGSFKHFTLTYAVDVTEPMLLSSLNTFVHHMGGSVIASIGG